MQLDRTILDFIQSYCRCAPLDMGHAPYNEIGGRRDFLDYLFACFDYIAQDKKNWDSYGAKPWFRSALL